MHVVKHDGAATHWTHVMRSNVDPAFCDLGGGGSSPGHCSPLRCLCVTSSFVVTSRSHL